MQARRWRSARTQALAVAVSLARHASSPSALADDAVVAPAGTAPATGAPAPPTSASGATARAPMPNTLDYDEGQPIPRGYRVSSQMREGLMIAGGVMFWASYVTSAVIPSVVNGSRCLGERPVGCYYDGRDYYVLDIPFAGPFIGVGVLHPEPGPLVGLVALGTLQVAGGGLFLIGLLARKNVLVRQAGAPARGGEASLAPIAGRGGAGLSLRGTF